MIRNNIYFYNSNRTCFWLFPFNEIIMKIILSLLLIISGLILHGQCNFKPIGHRGGSSYYYPENTLVSLEQGFMENTYAAEVDVRFTVDSILVLMHDSYIDRTTNGTGNVKELTLSYLKTLDAGSWKDPTYAGTSVPTLKEALLLANKYQKKLYLNMKVFAPQLIAKTLIEAKVPNDIVILDPDDLEKVEAYHKILPNTPLAYFGNLPQPIDNPEFYNDLKNNGVIAIEIPASYIREATDNTMNQLRDVAHSHNLELWAYTVNDAGYFNFLKDFGIDGLETDRPAEAFQVFCNSSDGGYFPEKLITGQWDFNNNLNGTIGSKLVQMGDITINSQKIKFGTTNFFGLPQIGNSEVNIANIPALDAKHALRFFSNIAPEGTPGGLSCDNTYTLVFDLLKPPGTDLYTAIFQTSNSNADDADFFLKGKDNSFGILEQYNGTFADNTWIRLALVFDLYNQKMFEYLDGELAGTITLSNSVDGRFCINNNWGVQSSQFFSDDDGETSPIFVSSIQLRDYAMSPDEIKMLGKTKATKIESLISPDTETPCPKFKDNIKTSQTDGVISLYANAGDSVNYKWEINKGSRWEVISGSTFLNSASSSLHIIKNSESLYGYKFRCIAFNDCKTISEEYLFKDELTGFEPFAKPENLFKMYPNPAHGIATIESLQEDQIFDIHIYTLKGVVVYKKPGVAEKLQVNLAKGIYLVHIQSNTKSEVKKLVVH